MGTLEDTFAPKRTILATWAGLYNLYKLTANFAEGYLHKDWYHSYDVCHYYICLAQSNQ